MCIYSNVKEQALINLSKLAEQQKNQQALIIKIRILKQTHDTKLAESLSPVTKKLDIINESTKNVGDVIEESQTETLQLAIEKFQPQLPIENNQDDSQPGVLYDVSLEKTLTKLTEKRKGFFK